MSPSAAATSPTTPRDNGRHLSAGFHNLMGYFRDDRAALRADARRAGRRRARRHVAGARVRRARPRRRTYVQFYLERERRGAATRRGRRSAATRRLTTPTSTSAPMIQRSRRQPISSARRPAGDADRHRRDRAITSTQTNAAIRWVEKARVRRRAAPPRGAAGVCRARLSPPAVAGRARRHLSAYYRSLREQAARSRRRDARLGRQRADVAGFLLPHRSGEAGGDHASATSAVEPTRPCRLSDYALASRLSYFLWSSMPDAELLARAAAGDLQKPRRARRAGAADAEGPARPRPGHRVRRQLARLSALRGAQRRRSRAFHGFDNELRRRCSRSRSGSCSTSSARIARSSTSSTPITRSSIPCSRSTTGCRSRSPATISGSRVDDAASYGRGGLLPMAVFLTKNAPGLRTSPVKRGYWVVKQRARRADSAAAGGGAGAAARRGQAGSAAARSARASSRGQELRELSRAVRFARARVRRIWTRRRAAHAGFERPRQSMRPPRSPAAPAGTRRRGLARLHPRNIGRTTSSTTCRASCWRMRSVAACMLSDEPHDRRDAREAGQGRLPLRQPDRKHRLRARSFAPNAPRSELR